MAIEWTPSLSFGVKYLDDQQRQMIDRINRLVESSLSRKGAIELEGAIKFLEAYVIVQFGAEEELMREKSYPAYQTHLGEHEFLKREIALLRKQFDCGGDADLLMNSARKLCIAWFHHHINNVDRSFGRYLKTPNAVGHHQIAVNE